METIKLIVALASVLFGIVALWQPVSVAKSAFIGAETLRGKGEIRASWGGLFIGLGLSVIVLNTNEAYMVFGAAYAGAALVRLCNAIFVPALFNRTFYIILGFEIISAVVFFIPV